MFNFLLRSETDHPVGDLPPLPPICHSDLGRQEPLGFSFSDRRRDPFEGATNAVLEFDVDRPPVTLESIAATLEQLVDLGPPPVRPPFEIPEHILMALPELPAGAHGVHIYWRAR